jgi:hypothetical protein
MPSASSEGVDGMWYSWNYGSLIHFVSLSTETDFKDAPEFPSLFGDQLAWLKADLAAAKAHGFPFIIAMGHRPIYSSAHEFSHHGIPEKDAANLQTAIEDLLHEYGVQLFIVGHHHAYERTYPVYQNKAQSQSYTAPDATTYLVVGSAGCEEGISTDWRSTPPSWLAHRFPEQATSSEPGWGYGIAEFYTDRLHWSFMRVDSSGQEYQEDWFELHLDA